ncbi:MAG: hypothetical protein AAGA56_02430, partial [Myxococcota bacterium]
MSPARRRQLVVGAAVAGHLVCTATAAAEQGRARLSWSRGDGADACIGPREVEARVIALLGYRPFSPGPDEGMSIEALVRREGVGFVAVIRVRDANGREQGRRVLEDSEDSCAGLAEAGPLAIALLIDPRQALRPSPPPSISAPPPQPDPSQARPEAAAPAPATVFVPVYVRTPPRDRPQLLPIKPRPRAATVSGAAGLVLAAGPLPRPAIGWEAELTIGFHRYWRASVGTRVLPAVSG